MGENEYNGERRVKVIKNVWVTIRKKMSILALNVSKNVRLYQSSASHSVMIGVDNTNK